VENTNIVNKMTSVEYKQLNTTNKTLHNCCRYEPEHIHKYAAATEHTFVDLSQLNQIIERE
jgi:S-methylmethionine-dependent homocysteine/selenocysteine methylase